MAALIDSPGQGSTTLRPQSSEIAGAAPATAGGMRISAPPVATGPHGKEAGNARVLGDPRAGERRRRSLRLLPAFQPPKFFRHRDQHFRYQAKSKVGTRSGAPYGSTEPVTGAAPRRAPANPPSLRVNEPNFESGQPRSAVAPPQDPAPVCISGQSVQWVCAATLSSSVLRALCR